jgi:hypothetical protein
LPEASRPAAGDDPPVLRRLALFPLAGALLFPRLHLPLHIFEPRYRAMVGDVLARDRRIGLIQPRDEAQPPALFGIGCVGRIVDVEAIPDGRYNILLAGEARFRVRQELSVTTPFRQAEVELLATDGVEAETLAPAQRAALEIESRRFADALGYAVDWQSVARLDDEALVNGIAQVAPFDIAAKQALLEAPGLADRMDLILQLMQFYRRSEEDGGATLQ